MNEPEYGDSFTDKYKDEEFKKRNAKVVDELYQRYLKYGAPTVINDLRIWLNRRLTTVDTRYAWCQCWVRRLQQHVSPELGEALMEYWREVYTLRNERYIEKVKNRERIVVDVQPTVDFVKNLLDGQPGVNWADYAIAIAFVTGRRCCEIVTTVSGLRRPTQYEYDQAVWYGKTDKPPIEKYATLSNVAKKKGSEPVSHTFPLLVTYDQLMFLYHKMYEYGYEERKSREATLRYANDMTGIRMRELGWGFTFHRLRSIYACGLASNSRSAFDCARAVGNYLGDSTTTASRAYERYENIENFPFDGIKPTGQMSQNVPLDA